MLISANFNKRFVSVQVLFNYNCKRIESSCEFKNEFQFSIYDSSDIWLDKIWFSATPTIVFIVKVTQFIHHVI